MRPFKHHVIYAALTAILSVGSAYSAESATPDAATPSNSIDLTAIPGNQRLPSLSSEKFKAVEFKGKAGFSLGCDGIGITNMFSEVQDNLELIFDNFSSNAMGLAMNMLIYSQPTLYQLLENLNISFRDALKMNITTCQGIRELADGRMKPIISKAKDKCIVGGHTKAYCDDGKKLIPYISGLDEQEKQDLIRMEDMADMVTFQEPDSQALMESFGFYGANEWEMVGPQQSGGASGTTGSNTAGAGAKKLPTPEPITGTSNVKILGCSAWDPTYNYFSNLVPAMKPAATEGEAQETKDRTLSLEELTKIFAEIEQARLFNAVSAFQAVVTGQYVTNKEIDEAVALTGGKESEPLSIATMRNLALLQKSSPTGYRASVTSIANGRATAFARRLVHMYEFAVDNAASSACASKFKGHEDELELARTGMRTLKSELMYLESREAAATAQRMTEIAISNAIKTQQQEIRDAKSGMVLQ
jgi:hypothetical protein